MVHTGDIISNRESGNQKVANCQFAVSNGATCHPVWVEYLQRFGRNLQKLRKSASLSQEKLAEAADVSLRYIQMLEAGEKAPSLETVVRLRQALGCGFEDLLAGLKIE